MKRDRCHTAVSMSKLLVRTALTYLREAETRKNADNLPRFEDRQLRHSAHLHQMSADKLRLDGGLAVLQKHCENLAQIRVQLIE